MLVDGVGLGLGLGLTLGRGLGLRLVTAGPHAASEPATHMRAPRGNAETLTRGGAFTKHAVRLMHNLALGLGWLPWPIIPPKLWPEIVSKPKRAITWEQQVPKRTGG